MCGACQAQVTYSTTAAGTFAVAQCDSAQHSDGTPHSQNPLRASPQVPSFLGVELAICYGYSEWLGILGILSTYTVYSVESTSYGCQSVSLYLCLQEIVQMT
jgi:hypothetical protein